MNLLIQNGEKHIQLESNFILKTQSKIFSKGINVFVDDMVIDGNGYVIDAQNNAPIFTILAKNITIKKYAIDSFRKFSRKNRSSFPFLHNE